MTAPVMPVAGAVCVPFRYFQSTYVEEPSGYTAIQSVRPPGPLTSVAVTVQPTATDVVLAVSVVAGIDTVIGALVARSAAPE